MKKLYIFTLLINFCLLGSAEVKNCFTGIQKSQTKHYPFGYFYFMETKEEVWKDVVGYEGHYKVSDIGNIFSVFSNRNITLQTNHKGYLSACFSVNSVMKFMAAHRVVALAFIPNPENKPQVNHIDGNKKNNRVDNLEWATCKENIRHSYSIIGRTMLSGADSRNSKRLYQYSTDGTLIKEYWGLTEACQINGFSGSIISKCVNKSAGLGYGFVWSYCHLGKEYFENKSFHLKYNAGKIISQYVLNGEFVKIYSSAAEVQRLTGFGSRAILQCCCGVSKTSHGFVWAFGGKKES